MPARTKELTESTPLTTTATVTAAAVTSAASASTDPFATNTAGKPFWRDYLPPVLSIALSMAAQTGCSVGMSVVNKELMNAFPFPAAAAGVQMVFTALLFATVFFPRLHYGSWRDTLRWSLIVPWLFGAQLATSLVATQALTLAQQQLFKNIVPILTLPIERFCTENVRITVAILLSLLVVLGGVTLFFTGEQTPPSVVGIVWLVVNQLLVVSGRLVERRFLAVEQLDLSVTGALLLNNSLGLLPVAIALFVRGEESTYATHVVAPRGYVLLGASCLLGLAIGWCGMSLQKQIPATSFIVLTNLNKVSSLCTSPIRLLLLHTPLGIGPLPVDCAAHALCSARVPQVLVIIYGMTFLGEEAHVGVIAGCATALAGGLCYSYAGLRRAARRDAEGQQKASVPTSAKEEALLDQPRADADGCCAPVIACLDRDIC